MAETVVEYFYQEYPKMLFNKQGEMTTVESEEDEAGLEGEWFESLRDAGIETCPAASRVVPMATILPGFVAPAPPAEPVTEEASASGRY